MDAPKFIYVTCQIGAEAAVKAELARKWPAFRFAYSRPGFLTFKLPPGAQLLDDLDLHSVFARAYGFSLGKATGATHEERAREVWQLAAGREFNCLQVWQRDLYEPGFRGYEPAMTELAREAEAAIRVADASGSKLVADNSIGKQHLESGGQQPGSSTACGLADVASKPRPFEPPNLARPGQLVLDCVIVEPHEWWIGFHRAASIPSRWPGGLFDSKLPPDAVSRAYLKMEEALAWSRMPLAPATCGQKSGVRRVERAKHS